MNNWKKFTAASMGAAMVGTTVFGASATVFAADTVTLDVWHQFTDPESAQTSAQNPIRQKSLQNSQAALPE